MQFLFPQIVVYSLIFKFFLQPIVAVPSFICADAFNKFLPFCTGFAAGCMIWMVVAEVLPDAFKVTSLIALKIYVWIFKDEDLLLQ